MLPIRGDPINVLFRLMRKFFSRCFHPVQIALISATLYFTAYFNAFFHTSDLLTLHIIYTGLFFACIWTTCHLFSNGIRRRLQLEGVTHNTAGIGIYTFVIYLEIIKHTVGVSFSLGWIAGVLACWDYLGAGSFFLTFAACMLVSLTAFVATYGFSGMLDNIHWPDKEDR